MDKNLLFKKYGHIVSCTLYPFLFLLLGYLNLNFLIKSEQTLLILLALPISFLFADFISGVVHWIFDSYGTEKTPILGVFIEDFRVHHSEPRKICESPLIEIIGSVAIITIIILPIVIGINLIINNSLIAFLSMVLNLVTLLTVLTNLFHKWSHDKEVNSAIRYLQKKKIILCPKHHQTHHKYPHKINYCITSGIMNPFLEKIKFFSRADNLINKIIINLK